MEIPRLYVNYVMPIATYAVAARLPRGDATAHSPLCIPIQISFPFISKIQAHSAPAKLLRRLELLMGLRS